MQINNGVITSHARELEQIIKQKEQLLVTRNSLPAHSSANYPAHLDRLSGQKESLQLQITQLREMLVKV
jgi:hypothetical protein